MKYFVPFDVTDEAFNIPLVESVRQELQDVEGVLSVDLLDEPYGRDLIVIETDSCALNDEIIETLAGIGDSITDQMGGMGYSGWGEIFPEQAMPEWVRPNGKEDAYMGGDIVFHDGKAFISQAEENVYKPGDPHNGWEPVEFEFVWTD